MSTCPYCGFQAGDIWIEVDHMNREHPEVIRERLEVAGLADLFDPTPIAPGIERLMAERDDYKERWEILGRVAGNLITKMNAEIVGLRDELALADRLLQGHPEWDSK